MRNRVFKNTVHSLAAYLISFALYGIATYGIVFITAKRIAAAPPALLAVVDALGLLLCVFLFSLVSGSIRKKGKLEFVKRLATSPGKHNYSWQGGPSVLTFAILFIIMGARSISCLQLSKQIYRTLVSSDKDYRSERPNVSPLFQELYFFIWAILLAVQLTAKLHSPVFYGLNIYFLIESLTWILYYSVFRRFFEENYSIYHVLEHLPLIICLIPMQAVAYALVTTYTSCAIAWKDVFIVLLGQASEHQTFMSFMGFLYSAIVISMVLSMFPAESIKKGNPDTMIVGAGDVVKNRLLPTIMKRELHIPGNRRGRIHIFDLDHTGPSGGGKRISALLDREFQKDAEALGLGKRNVESIYSLIRETYARDECVAWICTPSDSHWYYADLLKTKVGFLAIEKPLAANETDLEHFREFLQDDRRDRTFFLSYYLMEKALPLTFLCRPREFYLKYLDRRDPDGDASANARKAKGNESSADALEEFFQKYLESSHSGLQRFEMSILEGKEKRILPSGGQLTETFIHNCLVASLFAGLPAGWTNVTFEHDEKDHIELSAEGISNSRIHLTLEKKEIHEGNESQTADIYFQDGARIHADFKKKTAQYFGQGDTVTIGVSEKYAGKYAVQCDMVYECYTNNIRTSDLDGLYHQIEVLEWLLKHQRLRAADTGNAGSDRSK